MSEKCYRFVLPSGEYEDRFLRSNEDAIDFAKEDFDGISCVIIQREITEYHDIGTVENGVFTPATDDSASNTVTTQLLEALEAIVVCAKMKGPAGTTAYLISDQRMDAAKAAIAKAKGGAK